MSTQRKRRQLIDAISRSIEASNEAMRLALELEAGADDAAPDTPPNIVRPEDKTSPRLPFKTNPPGRPASGLIKRTTAYSFNAFTGERALRHVRDAYADAATDAERAEIIGLMHKLTEQGLFSEEDVADLLVTTGGGRR